MVEGRFLAVLTTWVPDQVLKGLNFTDVLLLFLLALLGAIGNFEVGRIIWGLVLALRLPLPYLNFIEGSAIL